MTSDRAITHLVALRARLGRLSQEEFATLVGSTRSAVCGWECGRAEAPLDKIAMILYPMGVRTEYVLGLDDSMLRVGYTEDAVLGAVRGRITGGDATSVVSAA